MKIIFTIIIALLVVGGGVLTFKNENKDSIDTSTRTTQTKKEPAAKKDDLIKLYNPAPEETGITSPLIIRGEARGTWFFEASFPVILTDWDGRIIAEHYAEARDEWMTQEYVPFESRLEFETPYREGDPDFMRRGTLILQKENPSGLPEHDNALEITVLYGR